MMARTYGTRAAGGVSGLPGEDRHGRKSKAGHGCKTSAQATFGRFWNRAQYRRQAIASNSLLLSRNATITLTVSDGELTTAAPFTVNVQLTPGGSWRQTNFGTVANTGNAADTADPDKDGCNNLLERALNGNPAASSPALTQAVTDTGALAIAFTRTTTATDLTLTVLAAGTAITETGAGTTRAMQVRDIFLTDDPAHPRRFLRLEAHD